MLWHGHENQFLQAQVQKKFQSVHQTRPYCNRKFILCSDKIGNKVTFEQNPIRHLSSVAVWPLIDCLPPPHPPPPLPRHTTNCCVTQYDNPRLLQTLLCWNKSPVRPIVGAIVMIWWKLWLSPDDFLLLSYCPRFRRKWHNFISFVVSSNDIDTSQTSLSIF